MGAPTYKRCNGIVGVGKRVVVSPARRRTKQVAASISEKFWRWQDYTRKKPAQDFAGGKCAGAVK